MRSVHLPAKMTQREKQTLADDMAKHARKMLCDSDPTEPATWRWMLRRIGCNVITWPGATPENVARYIPDPDEDVRYPLGIVQYNVFQPRRLRSRGLAHEFGHALLQKWVPQMLFSADVVFSFHDDPRDTRHQIAQMFDKLMIG